MLNLILLNWTLLNWTLLNWNELAIEVLELSNVYINVLVFMCQVSLSNESVWISVSTNRQKNV